MPLIVLWIALFGADRLDLAGGAAPVKVLPFYVLTVLVVVAEWARRIRQGNLPTLERGQGWYLSLVLTLVVTATGSVLRSDDVALSTARVALLASVSVGSALALWAMADRRDLLPLLARGARLGLLLAVILDVMQVAKLFHLLPDELRVGPVLLDLFGHSYGVFPRLTGTGWDINGSGGAMLVQTVLIALGGTAVRYRRAWIALGGILICLTLSRSSVLAAIPTLLLFPRAIALGRGAKLALAGLALAVLASSAALLDAGTREHTARNLAPLADRFNPDEGSAQVHTALLGRGLAEATADPARTLFGIGYGMSHHLLADLFPGSKAGNFHTLYFQVWVEAGVFALLAVLGLMAMSIWRARALRGLLIGLALYNVFYISIVQPAFWVALALTWFVAPRVIVESGIADRRVAEHGEGATA